MIPVYQTKLFSLDGGHSGNCLPACLASLLEIPLWMVPPFEDMFGRGDHAGRMVEWMNRMFRMELLWERGHPVETLPEFYIATGMSSRGVRHAVIYSKGVLVHDPHYSNAGIADCTGVYYLEPLEGTVP